MRSNTRTTQILRTALFTVMGALAGDIGLAQPFEMADPKQCRGYLDTNTPLSLSDAIDSALCLNAATGSAWAGIKIQSAQVGIARAAYLPTVNGSLTVQSNSTASAGFAGASSHTNGYSSYLGLNWRLFDFGERDAQKSAADHLLLAAMASHDDAVRKTLSETVRSYFSALQAQGSLQARKTASALAQTTLMAARRREGKGITSRSDTLQAETALARARMTEQRAKADFTKSIASLAYTMGLPSDAAIVLPDRMPSVPRDTLPDLAQLLADARTSNPAILASRAQRDASDRSVAAARAQGRPTVDFSFTNYRNGYPNQSVQANRSSTLEAGITLTIPLFDGFAKKHKISQAKAQAEKKAIESTDIEHQVLGQLVNAYADVVSSVEGVDTSAQLLQAATASLDSATNRYEYGVADILELITAQTALSDALEAQAQCAAQFNAARLKLLIEAGKINRDGLIDLNLASAAP